MWARPPVPVLLGHPVLDGDDRVALDQVDPVVGHLGGRQRPSLAGQHVGTVVPQLAGRRVERQGDLFARDPAGQFDRLHQQRDRVLVGGQVRRETPLVPDRGGEPAVGQHGAQHVVGLGPPAQRLAEGRRADRHQHELLEVDGVLGVGAAVQDVEHRDRERVRVGTAHGPVEGNLQLVGHRLGAGQRDGQDGVGPEPALVGRPVQVDQGEVDRPLVERVQPAIASAISPLTLATARWTPLPPNRLAAVAQLDRLVDARRCTRRSDGTPTRPGVEQDLGLDGRVATGVEDLAPDHVLNGAHEFSPSASSLMGHPVIQTSGCPARFGDALGGDDVVAQVQRSLAQRVFGVDPEAWARLATT